MTEKQRLSQVQAALRSAEREYGRTAGSVRLLGVSKVQPVAAIRTMVLLGLKDVGENYVQEALTKQNQLHDLDINWHFIGAIQSNKTRDIAASFQWVHSVDRIKIAQRLAHHRPENAPPINICLQINVDRETNKSGLTFDELSDVAHAVNALPNIKLRGLMAIPEATQDFEKQRAAFRAVREAQETLIQEGLDLDTLSMGMTADMKAAIAEGATIVRIGTALFGPRPNG